MNDFEWIKSIKSNIFNFITKLTDDNYSYIRYSLTGDIYDRNINWGLGQNVFMAKILFMLDLIGKVNEKQRINLIKNIKKFENKDGFISDPLIIKNITYKKYKFFIDKKTKNNIIKTKIAETRQSFSALNCLNEKPQKPFLKIPYSKKGINTYLSRLDWQRPWDAGSHFSHLLFFLNMNKKLFGYSNDLADELINYANSWVDNIQSDDDGFWYNKDTSNLEKINGAMKILTGKTAADIFYVKNHEKIIDLCLKSVNDNEACSNFNIVYCLYYCSNISDYRIDEIKEFCLDRLKIYKKFYHEKVGGFSFFINKANDIYYEVKITRGINEPDIHGTVMFLWGITLISKILKLDFIDFNIPLT